MNRVEKIKKDLLTDCGELMRLMEFQNQHRSFGIEQLSFELVLTEIALCKVLDIDLLEDATTELISLCKCEMEFMNHISNTIKEINAFH
jgi:hypothetical protein